MLLDLFNTLQQANARPATTHDIRVILFEGIDPAELQWVHPRLLAQFLYRRFKREVRLRTGRRAIGASTRLVGLNHVAADIYIGTAIHAGEMEASEASKRIGVGTRIKNHSGLDSGERTILLRA